MSKIANFIVNHKKTILILFLIVFVISFVLMLNVGQNYDMSKYLPKNSNSKKGIDVLEKEYAYNGQANLLLENLTIPEIIQYEKQIESIDGVESVIWLDDIVDLTKPVETYDSKLVDDYYKDGRALLQIVFTEYDYSEQTRNALTEIISIIGNDGGVSGTAVDANNTVNSIGSNIMVGIIIAVVIIILILIMFTHSVFEVFLFLVTIGISIVINMGTNIIFGEISYMTFASASILQLAISMDYSIFLLHRFADEKKNTDDSKLAMKRAIQGSFQSISSSAATTVAGFAALVFMSYTIGMDMGLVLAKGIVLSFISVVVLLPVLALYSTRLIEKTTHRVLLPSFKKMQMKLGGKIKYELIILIVIVAFVSFLAQSHNNFEFYSKTGDNNGQKEITTKINDTFGVTNQVILLVPNNNQINEMDMADKLLTLPGVLNVQGYYTLIDPSIPRELISEQIIKQFISENYSRYIVYIDAPVESDYTNQVMNSIGDAVSRFYDHYFITGNSRVIQDIKEVTTKDFPIVNLISILAVGLILLLTFRSIGIPLLLLLVIEASIWINMSIPYYSGNSIMFIGYMIVSAVQLGATIDYAILMTNYYQEGRENMSPKEAAVYAVEKGGHSIFTSAVILAAAGFTISFIFTQPELSQLGILVGRGALLSAALVIIALPQLLTMLDKILKKTTLKKRIKK
ncbi:MAG: MMPL family transporter [Clostridia bacterium]|nr:MMPL family transporter [Clostridia bacterium]